MTLVELKRQMAKDLGRSDMVQYIPDAIESAINHYQKERWFFLEGRATANTVVGQQYYELPLDGNDMGTVDSLLITISGNKEAIRRVHYKEMDEYDTGTQTGSPTEWAHYAEQFRLYPTPDAVYTLTLSYHKTLATLTDSESNAWTTDAKDLIRYRALKEIASLHLRDMELASLYGGMEQEEYNKMVGLNTLRLGTSRILKTEW